MEKGVRGSEEGRKGEGREAALKGERFKREEGKG